MSQNSFTVFTKVQDLEIQPSEVKAEFDGLTRKFSVFLRYLFRKPNDRMEFDILAISATLKFQEINAIISTLHIHPIISITSPELKSGEWLEFQLDETALEVIEKSRKGNLNFTINLKFQILIRPLGGLDGNLKQASGIILGEASIPFVVPKSEWVENLLSDFGYKTFKMFEIPLSHLQLNEAYPDIISEFNEADDYFRKQDYNKCVAHCRSTLDALHRNLKKIKEKVDSESNFKWLESINATTLEFITQLDKENFQLASKTHHPGNKRSFNRFEAQSFYLITLGLLNIVGNLK